MSDTKAVVVMCLCIIADLGDAKYHRHDKPTVELNSGQMYPVASHSFDLVSSDVQPLRERIPYGDDVIPADRGSVMRLSVSYDDDVRKWRKSVISWAVIKPSTQLPLDIVRRAMIEAFAIWSQVVPLNFEEVFPQSDADIKVGFERWAHGNHGSFDGPCRQSGDRFEGFVLAHAGFPSSDILHFDDDEEWTYNDPEKLRARPFAFDLVAVAVHEIGHSLGIRHLQVPDAIMNGAHQPPQFMEDGSLKKTALTPHDIEAAQRLYGPRKSWGGAPEADPDRKYQPSTTLVHSPRDPSFIPNVSSRSAVDGAAYFFKGSAVWRKSKGDSSFTGANRFPIDHIFPGAPSRVKAAVSSIDGRITFLFQGRKVYGYTLRTDNFALETGYPKDLPISFEPQGAFRSDNGVIVLYKDSKFVIWDNNWNQATFNGDLIQYFPDLPKQTVSLTVSDNLYFLNDRDYVVYDIRNRRNLGSKPKESLIMCSASPPTSDLPTNRYLVIIFSLLLSFSCAKMDFSAQ